MLVKILTINPDATVLIDNVDRVESRVFPEHQEIADVLDYTSGNLPCAHLLLFKHGQKEPFQRVLANLPLWIENENGKTIETIE